jgi:maltose alpha-D-glucosyltransferase/alpha-amylase
MEAFPRRRRFKGEAGELAAFAFRSFREISGVLRPASEPVVGKGGATNNSFVFGERFILKLFRHIEPGVHPELEMGRFLTERTSLRNVAPIAGELQYLSSRGESTVVGVLHAFVKHEADAWHFTLDSLSRFFERTQTSRSLPDDSLFGADGATLITLSAIDAPAAVHALIGEYLESSRLLGQRTAELHMALAGDAGDADFRPSRCPNSTGRVCITESLPSRPACAKLCAGHWKRSRNGCAWMLVSFSAMKRTFAHACGCSGIRR